jgi:hypothetical protein
MHMKRLGASIGVGLVAAMLLGGTALASNEWCDEDPIITAFGATFTLTTAINASATSVSSVAYVVDVPQNARNVSVGYPAGQGIPATVQIVRDLPAYDGDGAFPVVATVTVSAPSAAVIFSANGAASPASVTGTTGQALTLKFTVNGSDDQGNDSN